MQWLLIFICRGGKVSAVVVDEGDCMECIPAVGVRAERRVHPRDGQAAVCSQTQSNSGRTNVIQHVAPSTVIVLIMGWYIRHLQDMPRAS